MDDASLQLHTPLDRYHIVYFIFILHGIGTLMPWNMFINANDVSIYAILTHMLYITLKIENVSFTNMYSLP